MDQLTIRGRKINLPLFPEEATLEMVKSLNLASGLASRFDFSSATVRALDIKDARLTEGKISSVRTESTSIAAADVRCVEFSNCELGHLRWAGGRISQTRFNGCKLLGAKFENVFMEHVVFTDCKIDYAALNQMRTSGPVMFIRCSLREAEFTGCDMTRSLMDECDLALVNFESGKYAGFDLRGNDLSGLRGVHYLRRAIIDYAQLIQISQALAAELEITFGDELDDPRRR